MRSTEYPYYEDRSLLERPKSLNESRKIALPSSLENDEDAISGFQSNAKEDSIKSSNPYYEENLTKPFKPNTEDDSTKSLKPNTEEDSTKTLKLNFEKELEQARREFEKNMKEYQDQLAEKDLHIIMLQVQLESLEQKSKTVIDDVISKTHHHMQKEIAAYKKDNEKRINKAISDTKGYFEKKINESEQKYNQRLAESEKMLAEERKKVADLENIVKKNNQLIHQLKQKKKGLELKLERREATPPKASAKAVEVVSTAKAVKTVKAAEAVIAAKPVKAAKPVRAVKSIKSVEPTEAKPHSKATPFEIITTLFITGANLFFIFVIFPNFTASNWLEDVGLNDLSFLVRILLTLFGIMISLFCFVKAREATSKRRSTRKTKDKGHSLSFLLGVIVIGSIFLAIFLVGSNFLFFICGILLILLAGLLVIIDHGKSHQKQKRAKEIL